MLKQVQHDGKIASGAARLSQRRDGKKLSLWIAGGARFKLR